VLLPLLVGAYPPPPSWRWCRCPVAKAEALAEGFAAAHGAACSVVPEEKLNAVFNADAGGDEGAAGAAGKAAIGPPQTKGGSKPGAFAMALKCECPRCLPDGTWFRPQNN